MPMSKKLCYINVRGKQKSWSFDFLADPKYLKEWEADGLDVGTIENIIPEWAVDLGLTRAWCFVQDVFNFRNPWRRE